MSLEGTRLAGLLRDEDDEVAVPRGRFHFVVAVEDDVCEADVFEHQAQFVREVVVQVEGVVFLASQLAAQPMAVRIS